MSFLHLPPLTAEQGDLWLMWDTPLVSWGQFSQLCPLTAACAPQRPQWDSKRKERGLETAQAQLSNGWNVPVLPALLHYKALTQHHEEHGLCPRPSQHAQHWEQATFQSALKYMKLNA